jgi:uncharacterized protein
VLFGEEAIIIRNGHLREMERFVSLCFQHMNDIAGCLYDAPELFEPIFNEREVKGKNIPLWKSGVLVI